jgi:hypothetical protein
MSTINGIGTKFYGINGPAIDGKCTAIKWFTFVYIPLIPLYRVEIIREVTRPHQFVFQLIQKNSLKIKEVLKTYLYAILTLAGLFGPFILAAIYHDQLSMLQKNEDVITGAIVVYIIAFVWIWKDMDEKKGLPKDYKHILKQKESTLPIRGK